MLVWRPFDYKSLGDLKRDIDLMGLDIPLSDNFDLLREPIEIYGKTVKNRLAIQPMEGFDGKPDGTPSDLTMRRYRRYSMGGAGLIWMESISTTNNAKTCPRMSGIRESNVDVFRHIILEIKECAADGDPPFVVGQLTHCGRGANMDKAPWGGINITAYIACENPYLPRENVRILTDDDIWGIIDDYVKCAALMKQAGFDCVDIRACHGYLLNEMLSAYTRPKSLFGGSFENRTRMMLIIIDRINAEVGIPIATRLSVTDMVPYPYGWGMKEDGSMKEDFTEPLKLGRILLDKGVKLMNLSLGRNQVHHIQSPSDHPNLFPHDHQLTSVEYFQRMAAVFKKSFPEAVIITGNFAWLKQYFPYVAAGGIEKGKFDIAGVAKTALANPNFANEVLKEGRLDPKKICVTCGSCGALISHSAGEGAPTGFVTRDPEFYLPYFKQYVRPLAGDTPALSPEKAYPLKLFNLSITPPKQE
jgi:2,4-dienoyl-CoA reductase-like NADH-dependent reductase (Old Yellow Enzyme family)